MSLPPLHSFRVFESVARLGNVAAAAVELHVTSGAVSQQLKVLQGCLGIDLMEKKGRQLVLTEAGKVLQKHVASAIGELEVAVHTLRTNAHMVKPVQLTLSIPRVHGITWLATRLFAFMEENRNIKLNVISAGSTGQVDWRKADVAVVYGTPPWSGFWWRLLHGIRLTPVCSPQLLRGQHAIRSIADLSHHRLLHEDDGTQWRRWLAEARSSQGGDSDIYFDDFGMVLQAARDGFGVALSDEIVSARDLDDGRLVQPLTLTVPALHSYYCICSEGSRERPEVISFIEWLLSVARN
ncbi:LysR family transcriptional regulator [Pseudomonas sp. CG7]|uniref:LysR substrate-binding domain-containing protein n=1 Tax=Pseudomonas sp. CG7 TaxID=191007 RepID=UPI0020344181|nr:LysR substrate-binding domain-containing protein [Pseudomonas sp. CG7]MCM2459438.1 LysR family transcriptional regulator [Pseudomonas sp. CG7]